MNKLSTERAIEILYTIRGYYASLTAGYPKGKDCKGIDDVMCSEIANSCLMAIKALEQQNKQYELFKMGLLKDCESCKAQSYNLDEIRAEILRNSYEGFELGEGFRDGYNTAMVKVFNILDKYKAESED